MKYRIRHETHYRYSQPIALCHNQACLSPRDTPTQRCISKRLEISPKPTSHSRRVDFFGNVVDHFSIDYPHTELTARSVCEVEILPASRPPPETSMAWEVARRHVEATRSDEVLNARQFVYDSPLVAADDAVREFALSVFLPGRPLLESVDALMQKIHGEFTYDPGFTTISTPLPEVMAHRRGVCQDFAQLAIGCLRALKLPARYVSGYIETLPPPGQEKLAGADATHAWFAVYLPGAGWIDFDPTNNMAPDTRHITTAWGRDYSDVSPLKGVIFGGGSNDLSVKVDVECLSEG